MFKVNNSLLSSNTIDMFLKNMNIHDHNTRNKLDFHVIPHSLTVRELSIKIYGVNPLDARSHYTGGTVYQRHRQKPVYRRHGYQRHRPEAGIPAARFSTPQARSRYTGFVF